MKLAHRIRRTPPGAIRQRGITLVTALIMLVLLTLMAVTAFHIGTSQTVIVSNAQHRDEALDAAQQAIDIVLNSPNFMTNPAAAIATTNCASGTANTWCVDVNGDGAADVTVSLNPAPACIQGKTIPNSSLDFSNSNDLGCAASGSGAYGVEGATSGNSQCANTTWEVTAAANDTATNTKVTVVQGVSARVAATDLANNCP